MRTLTIVAALAALSVAACGSSDGTNSSGSNTGTDIAGFSPPPVPDGYTRLVAETVPDVKPGDDVTYCQYIMAPTDHDVDVLDVTGLQSQFGHHAVAFSYTATGQEVLGTSIPCMGTEFTAPDGTMQTAGNALALGAFLGGVGPNGQASATKLPDGVAVRLKKGDGVMLNVHYLNTGTVTIDGNAVVDIKFAEVDPNRKLAAMFVSFNSAFDLTPNVPTTSSAQCTVQSDMSMIMVSNHMHEFGTSVSTHITRAADGTEEVMHDDASWTYDMQFNPVFTKWSVDQPFLVHTGDTIKTSCTWDNTTANEMKFPREMCVGIGFALTTGDNPHAPSCLDGMWVNSLL